jgi:hypothetical protein
MGDTKELDPWRLTPEPWRLISSRGASPGRFCRSVFQICITMIRIRINVMRIRNTPYTVSEQVGSFIYKQTQTELKVGLQYSKKF